MTFRLERIRDNPNCEFLATYDVNFDQEYNFSGQLNLSCIWRKLFSFIPYFTSLMPSFIWERPGFVCTCIEYLYFLYLIYYFCIYFHDVYAYSSLFFSSLTRLILPVEMLKPDLFYLSVDLYNRETLPKHSVAHLYIWLQK